MRPCIRFVCLLVLSLVLIRPGYGEAAPSSVSKAQAVSLKEKLLRENTASLRFNWPVNKTFQTRFNIENTTRSGNHRVVMILSGTSTISTKKHRRGVQVNFSNSKVTIKMLGVPQSPAQKKFYDFLEGVAEMDSGYVISRKGKLLDVVNLKQFQNEARTFFESLLAEIPDSPEKEQVLEMANQAISRKQLLSAFEEDWNRNVGQWVGLELVRRAVYAVEDSEIVPIFDNAKVPIKLRLSYIGRTSCETGELDEKCVELYVDSAVDEDGFSALMKKLAKKFGVKEDELGGMSASSTLHLITEPGTLLPHRVSLNSRVFQQDPSGAITEKIDKHNQTFIYPEPDKKAGK